MTKTIIAVSAIAASMLLSANAFAASQTKTGEIKSIDTAKQEIVLSSGESFEAAKAVKLDALKSGEKVKITYDMNRVSKANDVHDWWQNDR